MIDKPLVLLRRYSAAVTYHFTAPDGMGWALCTVNDSTGELLITSDWGNWAYRWSPDPKHLGHPTLHEFLSDRAGADYVANKLLGREAAWVLDADATIKKWRKRLAERRLEAGRRYARIPESLRTPDYLNPFGDMPPLTAVVARVIWEDLGSLVDDESHESIFIEHAMLIDGIGWICERAWEDTEHRHSREYTFLVTTLVPALTVACATTVAERKAGRAPALVEASS